VVGTSAGSFTVVGLGISGVEPQGSASRFLCNLPIIILLRNLQQCNISEVITPTADEWGVEFDITVPMATNTLSISSVR
jgi:hypothetical protein